MRVVRRAFRRATSASNSVAKVAPRLAPAGIGKSNVVPHTCARASRPRSPKNSAKPASKSALVTIT